MTDWSVCESDDEWSIYNPPQGTYNSTEAIMPERLCNIFQEIEEKKILNLICFCPRKGAIKEIQESNPPQSVLSPTQHSLPEEKPEKVTKENADANKTFEAFDFDNDDNEKPSAKRKTPASVKRVKKEKVASMSNVMNDLLRHKLLDELEAAKGDESGNESKPK